MSLKRSWLRRTFGVEYRSNRAEGAITCSYGSIKQQSIGRDCAGGITREVVKEITKTATAAAVKEQTIAVRAPGSAAAEPDCRQLEPKTASTGDVGATQAATETSEPSNLVAVGARKTGRQRRLRNAGYIGAVAVALFSGYRWWDHARSWVETDNAYVTAPIHQISSRVAGTVCEVLAQDNQVVEAGAVLARLDRRDFEVHQQQAMAHLAQVQAQIRQASAQVAQAQAQVTREEAEANKARTDFERARALSAGGSGAISKQEFDSAQAAATAADANLQAAKSALDSASALTMAAAAQEQIAQANLKDVELQLTYTEILAPAAGRIGRKSIETGNRVQPGQALLALVEPDIWVVANFKETQLAHLRPGAAVRLEIDAFPGRVFTGRVESLAPASGAQFALLPPDNATGNFTKIVQRVPVKIVFDKESLGEYGGRIAAGMSVIVQVRRAG